MKTRLLHTAIFMALLFPAFYAIGQELKSSPTAKHPIQLGFQANISRFLLVHSTSTDMNTFISGVGVEGVFSKRLGSRFTFYTGLGFEFNMVNEVYSSLDYLVIGPNIPYTGSIFVTERRNRIFAIEVPTLIDFRLFSQSSVDMSIRGGFVFNWIHENTFVERFEQLYSEWEYSSNNELEGLYSPDIRWGINLRKRVNNRLKHELGFDVQAHPEFWADATEAILDYFNINTSHFFYRRVQLSARYTFYPQFGKR